MIQVKGYTAPEVQRAFTRARELIDQIGYSSQYFPVLFGLWTYYAVRGEWKSALELAHPHLEAAQATQEPFALHIAHRNMGTALMFGGDLVPAQEHLLQGIARYELHEHRSLAVTYHQEPTSGAFMWNSRNLWLMGYPDQAQGMLAEAVNLAQEVAHPFTLVFVFANAVIREIESRAFQSALNYNQALNELTQDQSAPLWLNEVQLMNGICHAHMDSKTQGAIASLTQALATRTNMGGDDISSEANFMAG